MITNISEHITYGEAVSSATAKANGIDNTPDHNILAAMQYVAENIFEKVRTHFGRAIKVSSFYRSPALNKAIGGSNTSQHCKGEAMDMDGDVYGSPSNKEIFEFIRDTLDFDQMIVEGIHDGKMDWVHCSCMPKGNRKQILFMFKRDGKSVYEPYTLANYKALIK
jgi:zinc D-Ala-D-Ala carboxypeptidase